MFYHSIEHYGFSELDKPLGKSKKSHVIKSLRVSPEGPICLRNVKSKTTFVPNLYFICSTGLMRNIVEASLPGLYVVTKVSEFSVIKLIR